MTYQIEAKDGTIYGTYEGETALEAFDAMVADGMGDEETAGIIESVIVTPVEEREMKKPKRNLPDEVYERTAEHKAAIADNDAARRKFFDAQEELSKARAKLLRSNASPAKVARIETALREKLEEARAEFQAAIIAHSDHAQLRKIRISQAERQRMIEAIEHHTVYAVCEPGLQGLQPEFVNSWSEVLALARKTGWTASCVQLRYDLAFDLIDKIELDPYQIEQDYKRRAR